MTTITEPLTGVCERCGAAVTLRPISVTSESYRWYASDDQSSWHCGSDPDFPVRAHEPPRPYTPLPANSPHDYESERGTDFSLTGPCAVCGRDKESGVHS